MVHLPMFLLLVAVTILSGVSTSNIAVCITNCGQCKQMFGMFFQGQACAESCIATNGLASPDCNNPTTVRTFLKRLL